MLHESDPGQSPSLQVLGEHNVRDTDYDPVLVGLKPEVFESDGSSMFKEVLFDDQSALSHASNMDRTE